MSSTAYVFPGQGAQKVGMGADVCKEFPSARAVFERADAALGFPLSRLCFEGPAEELKQTVNAQPAVMVVSLAYLEAARSAPGSELPAPSLVAGHSLGEYTALVCGGALSLEDGVRLVRERGRLMQEAGQANPGSMLAALGAEMESLTALCCEAGVEVANINCPGQIVISGSREGLDCAIQVGPSRGIRKFVPLEVSGAFHSRLMKPACEGLESAIKNIRFNTLGVPLVANVSAQEIVDPAHVREELISQVCGCVQWQGCIEHMLNAGVSTFIEIGPGQVLSGLIKRTIKEVRALNIGSVADIAAWRQ